MCGPCKHTSAQSSRFLAKNPFSFLSQWFPLLKTNATARYLSLIRGYSYGSYLKVTQEMKNKQFLLCGASVSFLFLTAHISTSVLQHCFNTHLLRPYNEGELCLKKKCVFWSATVLGRVICLMMGCTHTPSYSLHAPEPIPHPCVYIRYQPLSQLGHSWTIYPVFYSKPLWLMGILLV